LDSEGGSGIAVREGRAYVTGSIRSTDFPTPGAFDTTFNRGSEVFVSDAFVTKLPTG
jgi:hypothetical protein